MLNLLLIEDTEGDARLIKAQLPREQFVVHVEPRLSSALASIAAHDFDLILLDLHLPDSSGLATVERVHEATPALPIVVLTGHAAEGEDLAGCGKTPDGDRRSGPIDGSCVHART